jgi:drug/metabolite transporter (DMT)-like permease
MKKDSLYSVMTMVLFGVSSVLYKIFYSMGLNSVSISFYTAFFSTLFLFIQKLAGKKNLKFLKISKKDFLLSFVNNGLFGLFLINFSIITSLQYVPVGVQQLITNSNPIVVMIIYAIFMHKKPKKQDVVSCFLLLLGLYLVVDRATAAQNTNTLVGFIFCFLSMVVAAVYSTILAENPTNCDDIVFYIYSFLGYLAAILVKISLAGEFDSIVLVRGVGNILFSIVSIYLFCTLSYVVYKKGLVAIGPVKHLIITAFSPVVSILLSFLLFGENITLLQSVGGVLILLSSMVPFFVKN